MVENLEAKRIHFSKTDIGGEILPILTMGLYRYTLDALREYIQNSIDANPGEIEIGIDPDTVTITDTGDGMNALQARKALRLGISDKNPTRNVGFRGIGIYSGFNLCDLLEIFTKTHDSDTGYHLSFDFSTIRIHLLEDQERRKNGLPSKLHLEGLLEDAVYVEEDHIGVIERQGTKVLMSGLLPDAYETLLNWEGVESYLQNVVPLPFHPEFKFGAALQKKFSDEDYRVVPLTLQINDRRCALYRPYTNGLFAKGGRHRPKYFPLGKANRRLGFAWVCINDQRKVLKDAALRGLLIKKFDFSIADRKYLEPYFPRPVFNRRITGEIIIQHDNLLPNAARSDFENNSTRHEFLRVIPDFIKQLSKWANGIQQQDKAIEVLSEVTSAVKLISDELPGARRDKNKMLEYTVKLANLDDSLRTHGKILGALDDTRDRYSQVQKALRTCKEFVRNAVSDTAESYERLEKDVERTIEAERALSTSSQEPEPLPDLLSILEGAGFLLADDVRKALALFESEILLAHLNRETYTSVLLEFKEVLEDRV